MLFDPSWRFYHVDRILREAAGKALDRKGLIERELDLWLSSSERRRMREARRYLAGDHDILRRRRELIGPDGELVPADNLPNERIVNNQFARVVAQKVNYLCAKPLTFRAKDRATEAKAAAVFGPEFMRTFRILAEDAVACGQAWAYACIGRDGRPAFRRFPPDEIMPWWSDVDHNELEFACRVYDVVAYDGDIRRIETKCEIYGPEGVERCSLDGGKLSPDGMPPAPYVTDGERGWNWGRVPLVCLRSNHSETPLLSRIKTLQDGINRLLSDFANNTAEDVRTSVIVLKNYDGENLAEFRRNLMAYGAVKVRTVDGGGGGVDVLKIEANPENYRLILGIFQRELIRMAGGYDTEGLKDGSPNQMTVKSIYNEMDLDANEMETELQAAFRQLLWFAGKTAGFDPDGVDVIFNRDTVVMESQVIQDIRNSVGILSSETLVAQHPYVDDPAEELRRIAEEKAAAQREAMRGLQSLPEEDGGADEAAETAKAPAGAEEA